LPDNPDTMLPPGGGHRRTNIILVGMPGSGKSTIGVLLAKALGLGFVDTDILIQEYTAQSLQDIVDTEGYLALRTVEEDVILRTGFGKHIIATGGSAIYSEAAMKHLKANGVVVFLDVDLEVLTRRIRDFSTRGIAMRPGQSFTELFKERVPLYKFHADIMVRCSRFSQDETRDAIVRATKGWLG
jgi:shikimate kinase